MLRTLSLLCGLFLFLAIILLSVNTSFGSKIKASENIIAQNDQMILSLQKLALQSGGQDIDISLFQNKSFAEYGDVIPFIPYLEKLLSEADPQAEVAIRSDEDQIFLDHFADYRISLKVQNKEKLFKAMDELHNSRFIAKILNFSMNYKPVTENGRNEFTDAEFTVRLYLK